MKGTTIKRPISSGRCFPYSSSAVPRSGTALSPVQVTQRTGACVAQKLED